MKTLIQLFLVILIFGGLSAVGTVFWQQRTGAPIVAGSDASSTDTSTPGKTTAATDDKSAEAESARSDDRGPHSSEHELATTVPGDVDENPLAAADPPRSHVLPAPGPSDHSNNPESASPNVAPDSARGETPVAVRPPYTPEGDEAGALINLLRDRARAASEKERRIAERQDAIKLIFEDLRTEQAQTLKMRDQLTKELQQSRKAFDAALQGIDAERIALQKEQAAIRQSTEEALRAAAAEQDKLRKQLEKATVPNANNAPESGLEKSADDNSNLKKMAAVFDSMPAENVAKVFLQLVKNKRSDAVVWLMNSMKERQTAKVLGVIAETNAELAADLTERLKRLKALPVPPAGE